jgi:hypothetical protein
MGILVGVRVSKFSKQIILLFLNANLRTLIELYIAIIKVHNCLYHTRCLCISSTHYRRRIYVRLLFLNVSDHLQMIYLTSYEKIPYLL